MKGTIVLPQEYQQFVVKVSQALHTGGALPVLEGWTHGQVLDFRFDVKCVVYRRGGTEMIKVLTQNVQKQTGKWWQEKAAQGHRVSQVQYGLKNGSGLPRYNMGAGVVVDQEYTEYERRRG